MSDYPQANLPSKSVLVGSKAVNTDLAHLDGSRELALTIARAAEERKAGDIVLLGVAEVSYLSDYFVLLTGYSRVQVRAIAGAVEESVEKEWQRRPIRTEGQSEGSWVLQDFGDVIVHIMMPKEREFYNLEAFWVHAERIEFSGSVPEGD